jgi:hypothetical protein
METIGNPGLNWAALETYVRCTASDLLALVVEALADAPRREL